MNTAIQFDGSDVSACLAVLCDEEMSVILYHIQAV
jgi:hypothetical protein